MMTLYPVIMCGGAGTRLWPASRPSRPKQFIPLAGNRSLFQEAALRAAPLVSAGGRLLVVGGVDHRRSIIEQLEQIGIDAQVLLEPEARDSAAAMAAAAAWTAARDPDGVNAFVASDHHIPDHDAFRKAVLAAADEARSARIVTLGVKPTHPSAAYGYIHPAGSGLSAVTAFVEKPDQATARRYIESGYLWNSGNFIVSASVFLKELATHAPSIENAAKTAVAHGRGGTVLKLSDAFRHAPKVSVDYAIMEKTHLASVLEVGFAWSDLGAWDMIAASGEGDIGGHVFEDAEGCLARAADGMLVAAVGVRNLAIVAERDAVLVCDLSRAQDVKKVVERIRRSSPQHVDFVRCVEEPLDAGARRLRDWLRLKALPLWSSLGQDEEGAFAESLALDGRAVPTSRRARVQARQIYVFAQAGLLGWRGPWARAVRNGLASLEVEFLRGDGQMRALLDVNHKPLDETALVYDQAFYLLALATALKAGIVEPEIEARAVAVREALEARAMENGAFREGGEFPFQSNAHMHMLEAASAWEAVSDDPAWGALASRMAGLAQAVFIDPATGRLREFFDEAWRTIGEDHGRVVEPGHQFEWAWLLVQYGRRHNDADALQAARRLYAAGREGVSERHRVAVDALNDDGSVRTTRARLWPQTEWLRAALVMAQETVEAERGVYMEDAASALRALWLYLTTDGLWRDKRLQTGGFIEEPAPAGSLYHIVSAFTQLSEFPSLFGDEAETGSPLQ
ncbi:AGE family epimerase/isomerase [Brevundimonas pondensis]|uniref:AGE family epimerase/isomerase n=1 Tax=Brevundimonas pondensis TaxID=2774189 RepID=UPI003207CBB7